MRTRSVAFVWTTIGAVCGFVVLAAWSFGLFFFFEALILIVAGLVHLPTIAPRWKILTAPLWLIVGATGIDTVFLLRSVVFNATHGCVSTATYSHCESVSYAPVMIWGAWLLVAASIVLAVGHAIASARPQQAR